MENTAPLGRVGFQYKIQRHYYGFSLLKSTTFYIFFKHLTNQVSGSPFWHKGEASHLYGDPTHSGISLPALTGSTGLDNANPCTSCPAKGNTLYFLSFPFNACLERSRVRKVLTTYLGTSSGKVHRAQVPERRKQSKRYTLR